MRIDETGAFWSVTAGIVLGGTISAGVELINQIVTSKSTGENIDWKEAGKSIGIAALTGAISGGFSASAVRVGGQMIVNCAISAVTETYNQIKEGSGVEEAVFNVVAVTAISVGTAYKGGHGVMVKGGHYSNLLQQNNTIKAKIKSYQYKSLNYGAKVLRKNVAKIKSTRKNITISGIKSTIIGSVFSTVLGYRKKIASWLKKHW